MYNMLNANITAILNVLNQTRAGSPQYHVAEYQWLLNNFTSTLSPGYKQRYANYWGMNPFFPATALPAYFSLLTAASAHKPVSYANALMAFYPVSRRIDKSFISKLCHTCSPHLPLIDSYISNFYFFSQPPLGLSVLNKVAFYDGFHRFLQAESKRVLTTGVLTPAINAFRAYFSATPSAITDEKIIDSLIWGWSQVRGVTSGDASVTLYPYVPTLPTMTPRQKDGVWRKLKRDVEKRREQGIQIGTIVLRSDPNGIPPPDWFLEWCEEAGINIIFIDNDINGEIIADETTIPDWMREAVSEKSKDC